MARPRPAALCHHAALRRPSSPDQTRVWPALWREHPQCLMQTQCRDPGRGPPGSELFPERRNYPRRLRSPWPCGPPRGVRHGIWLEEAELQRLHASGAALAPCPTSNFSWARANTRCVPRAEKRAAGAGRARHATSAPPAPRSRPWPRSARPTRPPSSIARRCRPGHSYYLATRGGARAL